MSRRLLPALALAIAVLAAACGVAPQDEASRVDPASVPFGLLEGETTTTAADAGSAAVVYLSARDRLIAVDRTIADDAGLADLLELVVAGPNEDERSLDITTKVPAGTVASADASRGVAQVDLTEAFGDVRSGNAVSVGQFYEVGREDGRAGVVLVVEGLLPLPHHTEKAIVDDGDVDVQALLLDG